MAISTAIESSARARTFGLKAEARDLSGGNARFLPMRIAVIAQGATAATF